MKNYTITVNGRAYDVTVEERKGGAPFVPAAAPAAAMPATPVAASAPAAAPAAPVAAGGSGNVKVEAGAAGKVFKVEAPVGTVLKAGDPIIILEVMKMETPVVAPKDGVVASINVSEGQMVEAGELLATMNDGSAPAAPAPAPAPAPAAAPAPAPVSAPAAPAPAPATAAAQAEGSIKVEAGAAGKVFKVEAPVGTALKAGDPIITLEVMKMETPVVAPKDGVVASINVTEGQMVEAGELLATMNE